MTERLAFLPQRLTSGETIYIAADNGKANAEDIIVTGYLPSTHTLQYQFAGTSALSVDGVANGAATGWTLTVTAAQTLLWRGGTIPFVGFATKTANGMVTAIDQGSIAVTASPLTASWATTALAAVEAKIEGRASSDQESFTLGDMAVKFMAIDELVKLRDWLRAEVKRNGPSRIKRIIRTRFT